MKGTKIKVLFIGGSSRIGSTLLDRMLSHIDGFLSVGELRHIWEKGLTQNQLCGCGTPLRECEFWRAVGKEAFGGLDQVNGNEIKAIKQSVDHLWHIPHLVSPLKTVRFKNRLKIYSQVLSQIDKAIQKVSGCNVIVDSSKYPFHGLILNTV